MMTPSLIKQINNEIQIALQGVGAKYGVQIQTGRSQYGQTQYTTTLTVAEVSQTGVAMTGEATIFNLRMKSEGKDWRAGDKFNYGVKVRNATIIGLNTRNPKNSLQIEVGGESYRAPLTLLDKAVKL